MQVTVEKLSPVLLEVAVQIPAERVKSEVEKAYSALQRTARVKGFRPGKRRATCSRTSLEGVSTPTWPSASSTPP
jgi:FKBP-type peptidyl-prolyl cis-trans isomerase (trigger factor)